ncbi:hypothetical protein WJX75_005879 [Coccomyxa subellipsoidea]|uniref:Fe2OG dioxygenase domain-containing protein n=1 Tax=Coccomyxa subellipsoidea TaxID=248742 RepID=A0ABR2YJM8_9CHLO
MAEKKYQLHWHQEMRNRKGKLRGGKLRQVPTDLSGVLDFQDRSMWHSRAVLVAHSTDLNKKVFGLASHPGFYVICGAMSAEVQQHLIMAALQEYTEAPSNTNHTRVHGQLTEQLLRKLRWATLGPQFDWTARVYDVHAPYRPLPAELRTLAVAISSAVAGLDMHPAGVHDWGDWEPDVALVNYYREGDTLGGHKDDAEQNLCAPIVALSLGCDAIFLLGGETRDEEPVAMRIRGGDAVVMEGSARQVYHGVPRVFSGDGCRGKSYCPYTKLTKEALFAVLPRSMVHTEDIDLRPDGDAVQAYLTLMTGKPTVPYVFANGEFVGGSEETIALLQTGTLPALLAAKETPIGTAPPGVAT